MRLPMLWTVERAPSVTLSLDPAGTEVISFWSRIVTVPVRRPLAGVAAPPSAITISDPLRVTALRTATRCLYQVVVENETLTIGAPNVSRWRTGDVDRVTLPCADSIRRPPSLKVSTRAFGRARNDVVGRLHGSGAISTGARRSMPFDTPLRKWSNQARSCVAAYSNSALGFAAGAWPKSPR